MEQIENLDSLNSIIENISGVLVYFYNDDCAPCISLRPKVESMVSEEFPKMKLVWVNSKKSPGLPASYGVFSNPTLLIFFEGKEFRRFSKYVSVVELTESISRYYSLVFE